MQVFKFGGASVSSTERIKNVAQLLGKYRREQLVIVISAMGKTTNALEKVVAAFFEGKGEEAMSRFGEVKTAHCNTYSELMPDESNSSLAVPSSLADLFTEVEWLLHDKPVRNYDYYYDQIVPLGELLSTRIVSDYLTLRGIDNKWLDVRDVLRTDNTFRDAQIDWTYTHEKVAGIFPPLLADGKFIVTQGFIGATDENESTTLGREGSDYTASVFSNLLEAEKLTIWKDVPGIMNADPKEYEAACLIKELPYKEVIEMAYYGAQVIHPKTIKPLQNKEIPLFVRSFIHPEEEGTLIQNKQVARLPPIIVYKKKQVLVQFTAKDYSFVSEGGSAAVYRIFEELKFKSNLTQHGAISMLCVTDDHSQKVESLALAAALDFEVQVWKNLTLLTIRHYNKALLQELSGTASIILQQQTPETVQLLMQGGEENNE